MIAHIRKSDKKPQPLSDHCRNVKKLAEEGAEKSGIKALVGLTGLLHDMGKATSAFQEYIKSSANDETFTKDKIFHSPIGAIFAYERWFINGNSIEQITAQIISLAIRGHHGGLIDCVNQYGRSVYLNCIEQDKEKLFYDQAVSNYYTYVATEEELDNLFSKACEEVRQLLLKVEKTDRPFTEAMLARMVLSFVVDADRWDTACFENDKSPFQEQEKADWANLLSKLEAKLATFDKSSEIGKIRWCVSEKCAQAANKKDGIYTLTVPTGGGKTLSSLRFALNHAIISNDKERIFYIIPFNTILEQNSEDIREALNGYSGILEHYGTYISELEGDEGKKDESEHLLLTERWNMPIIMTSVVQFMNSLFRAENTDARRMNRLARSILIFDEVQALPKHCLVLFEKAIKCLVACFGCTVLLCTATQPKLDIPSQELLPDNLTKELFSSLHRTEVVDEIDIPRDNARAAIDIAALLEKHGSVLVVVNTKRVAADLFKRLKQMQLPATCIHLSTNMCAAHRLSQIENMKKLLNPESGQPQPVLCISTMLIEAGVNISFPCVVRSLSGLSSVIQAAGRCNRHMEQSVGYVYLWRFTEENLRSLEEIRKGQQCTYSVREMINNDVSDVTLDSRIAMDEYFKREKNAYPKKFTEYLWPAIENATLTDMYGSNTVFRSHTDFEFKHGSQRDKLRLFQAFQTAGKSFKVIDQDTVPIIVPYKDGKKIIADLSSDQPLDERIRTLRKSQAYSVAVWRDAFQRLCKEEAIYSISDTGMFALRDNYYNEALGIIVKPEEMDFMNY